MPILIVAIAAMLIQQTVATTAKLALPAVFPAAAKELGFNPEFVLMLTSANAAFGILVIAGCGGAIRRWGGTSGESGRVRADGGRNGHCRTFGAAMAGAGATGACGDAEQHRLDCSDTCQ